MENKNWKEEIINLGEVIEGDSVKVRFVATRKLKIDEVLTSCGCSTPKYDKKMAEDLVVVFKADSIPRHLESLGYYTTTKNITVFYRDKDMGEDHLKFKAKIIKKVK